MSHVAPAAFAPALPDPAARPGADVVIYDGHCKICTAQVQRLARWDTSGRLAYLSLHDPEVARRWPHLTHDELMREMVIMDSRGHRHGGADAVVYLTRRLTRLWWAAPLAHLPGTRGLWHWLYRQVALRRYRFGRVGDDCPDGSCALHRR
ncbi:MAG: DUF393 domain-containing protein [Pirellulales bacterium]|nr:DUF393 domain-containing protein [Pirellulales bacterium]